MRVSEEKLRYVFESHLHSEYERLQEPGKSLVHYTSAGAALEILQSKTFWLRTTRVMNDVREIAHGTNLVREYFDDRGKPFFDCLNRIADGLSERVTDSYNQWVDDLERNTFVGCLSEHEDVADQNGKLSMWRGYGARGGVALVVDPFFIDADTEDLETYSVPVLYFTDARAESCFEELCKRVVMEEEFLKEQGEEVVHLWAFNALQTFGLTLKHPAFEEEREWRLIHRPVFRSSKFVPAQIRTVRGVPQVIHALPLVHHGDGLSIDLKSLLKKVIIGPCENPDVAAQAFAIELSQHMSPGEAWNRIHIAQVPLRASSGP
jgi:Protein of unknown function (DUF2971)